MHSAKWDQEQRYKINRQIFNFVLEFSFVGCYLSFSDLLIWWGKISLAFSLHLSLWWTISNKAQKVSLSIHSGFQGHSQKGSHVFYPHIKLVFVQSLSSFWWKEQCRSLSEYRVPHKYCLWLKYSFRAHTHSPLEHETSQSSLHYTDISFHWTWYS